MLKLLLFVTGILASSFIYGQKDDPVRFELTFTLRALPDNGWFLNLHEDGSYEYKHWSGFGGPEGTILEKGKYQIVNDEIILDCEKGTCQLSKQRYFIHKVSDKNERVFRHLDRTKEYELRSESREKTD